MIEKTRVNELVKSLGRGDDGAFEELYHLMYRPLISFVRPILFEKQKTDDIIHKTFEIVISKSREKMTYTNCFSWIFTIARNVAMTRPKAESVETPVDFAEKFRYSVDEGTVDMLDKIALREAVGKLTPMEQQMILLRFGNQYTFREIADICRTSESTVKRKVS